MQTIATKFIRYLTALALVTIATSRLAASTVVFDNLSPTTPYYNPFGNWLGTLGGQYEITATTFTPSATGQLDALDLGLFYQTGVNSVTLRLSPDTAGLPGVPIWQTTVPPAPGYGSLLSLTGIAGPVINAGQTYWLEGVAPVTPTTLDGWYVNNQGDSGPVIASGNYVANTQRFSLRVAIQSKVPEPASCLLAMVGLAAVASIRRR